MRLERLRPGGGAEALALARGAAAHTDAASLARPSTPAARPGSYGPRAGTGVRPRVWGLLVEGMGHHRAKAEVGRPATEPGGKGAVVCGRALRGHDRWRLQSERSGGRGSPGTRQGEDARRSSLRGITVAVPRGSGTESRPRLQAASGHVPKSRDRARGHHARGGVHSGRRWGRQARPRRHAHAGLGRLDVVLVSPADGGRLSASTCTDREARVPSGGSSRARPDTRALPRGPGQEGGGGRRAGGQCLVTTVPVWMVRTIWGGRWGRRPSRVTADARAVR